MGAAFAWKLGAARACAAFRWARSAADIGVAFGWMAGGDEILPRTAGAEVPSTVELGRPGGGTSAAGNGTGESTGGGADGAAGTVGDDRAAGAAMDLASAPGPSAEPRTVTTGPEPWSATCAGT